MIVNGQRIIVRRPKQSERKRVTMQELRELAARTPSAAAYTKQECAAVRRFLASCRAGAITTRNKLLCEGLWT